MATGYLDNYYARLGINRHATQDEIRKAYHLGANRLNPDDSKSEMTDLFLQIQEAYEVLSDPTKRSAYDKTIPSDAKSPEDIMINALYSREILPVSSSPQLIYVLLDLMALPDPEDQLKARTPPYNVSLVVDTSTSMQGDRLNAVKQAAFQLVDAMNMDDVFSLISFNDRAEVIVPATRGIDYRKINSQISQLKTQGGTEIFNGLSAGMGELKRNMKSNYMNHLILITDGRTYGDEDECLQLANLASNQNVTFSCMGIGDEWHDEFLDHLANRTGGSSYYASDPSSIEKFLKKKFRQISNVYANNATMKYSLQPGVELRYAFRLSPDPVALEGDEELALGDIPIGKNLSFLMEFVIDKIDEENEESVMANGELHLNFPFGSPAHTVTKFSLGRPVGLTPPPSPPPHVLVKAMSKLSLYRMQEQAQVDFANGDIEKATQKLNALATQLLDTGESGLAQTVMLQLNNIESGNSISEETKKQIKYGTRALILPENTGDLG